MPQLYNLSHCNHPDDAIYIGRGSPWGNPFVIGRDGTRSEVIKKYEEKILPNLDLTKLIGRDLVCHCTPQPCHGDSILNKLREESFNELKRT